MVRTVLLIACLAAAAVALAAYLWDTRDERQEFARRMERAENIRASMSGGRLPRGGPHD